MHIDGHTIQLYSFQWKPKIQSHDWLPRDIERYLLINMKTMYKTRCGRTSERGKKRYETSVIGRQEKKKKRNMTFFTSCYGMFF